ncbi:MAG: hypothetical protein NZ693_09850 [Thermoflexales bacterium]|nr:hypothetical protein [Thermoflexales bacterium]
MDGKVRFALVLDDVPHHLAPLPRGLLPLVREGESGVWLFPRTRTAAIGDAVEIVGALELFGESSYVRLDRLRVVDLETALEALEGGLAR